MHVRDRVYGTISVEDAGILDLIGCPTFQRLKGVRQAGPSASGVSVQGRDAFRA